ncbi:hypothetical protein K250101E9_47970 [Enterocloster aldenensis]|uniref:hypothetical protein n=1 Tax=Enterocloster aldenensis TaxID=358742 RepID=UPI0034AF812F
MSDIWIPYGGGSGGVDCDNATATAVDVRKGKTAGIAGQDDVVVGTMTEKAAATYTPGTTNQVIAANQFLAGAQTIKGDANLIPANIKSGKSIFGVAGSLVDYTYLSQAQTPF